MRQRQGNVQIAAIAVSVLSLPLTLGLLPLVSVYWLSLAHRNYRRDLLLKKKTKIKTETKMMMMMMMQLMAAVVVDEEGERKEAEWGEASKSEDLQMKMKVRIKKMALLYSKACVP